MVVADADGEVRGDRIYGRGSSDDGAGITVHLGSLSILGEDLPVNVDNAKAGGLRNLTAKRYATAAS